MVPPWLLRFYRKNTCRGADRDSYIFFAGSRAACSLLLLVLFFQKEKYKRKHFFSSLDKEERFLFLSPRKGTKERASVPLERFINTVAALCRLYYRRQVCERAFFDGFITRAPISIKPRLEPCTRIGAQSLETLRCEHRKPIVGMPLFLSTKGKRRKIPRERKSFSREKYYLNFIQRSASFLHAQSEDGFRPTIALPREAPCSPSG